MCQVASKTYDIKVTMSLIPWSMKWMGPCKDLIAMLRYQDLYIVFNLDFETRLSQPRILIITADAVIVSCMT